MLFKQKNLTKMNPKYSIFLKIVCVLICLHSYSTDGQTTDILFYEDFTDESNNATTGTDDYNIDWQIDLNGANPREFKVKNDEFKSKDTTHLCIPTCGSLTKPPGYGVLNFSSANGIIT